MADNFVIEELMQISAKIEMLDDNGSTLSLGSGTILSDGKKFFIATAGHCLKKKDEESLALENIKISIFIDDEWKLLKVQGILDSDLDKNNDFAILEISPPPTDFDYFNKVKICKTIVDNEDFNFFGYTSILPLGRIYSIKHTGKDTWHLFDTGIDNKSKSAKEIVGGNSGAGIFFRRYNVYYMVGYVKGLIDENGTNSDIVAFPVSKFESLPKCIKEDDILHLIEKWEVIRKKRAEDSLIKEYIEKNVELYNNLLRKMGVIYDEEEKGCMVKNYIEEFLKGIELNALLGRTPMLLEEIRNIDNEVFEDINNHRPCCYSKNIDAYNDLKCARDKLKKALENVIVHDSETNALASGYANFSVANRLLICSLNYKNREE